MVRKFQFDDFEDFDRKIVQLEIVESPPPPPTFSEDELAAARAAAFAQGQEAGRREVETGLSQQIAGLVAAIEVHMAELVQREALRDQQFERDAVRLAHAMLRKLAPTLAERGALAEIEALVAACFEEQHDEPRIVVRLHDQYLDPLKERIEAIAASQHFAGKIVLIAEPSLAPTDVRVEWADGGAERRIGAVLAALDQLAAEAVPAPSALDTAATATNFGA